MESSSCLSPESTVTSLLSSSGHLLSSHLAPERITSFTYRDKNYGSASAALDAYIADFENSCQYHKPPTARLILPQSEDSLLSRPGVSVLRNKDVLQEYLTDKEVDFLNLPVSSLHHSSCQDRLSMTTDDLLSIPKDGSLPVTHTSAFIQGLLCQSAASEPCSFAPRSAHRTWGRLSSSVGAAPLLAHHHSHAATTPRSSRCRGRQEGVMLKPEVVPVSCYRSALRAARPEQKEPSSSLHRLYPLTSNKPGLDCSGISSVQGLKYPTRTQSCDFRGTELMSDCGFCPPPKHRAPSWVQELTEDDPDQTMAQVDSQKSLRDLRLQLAEQISVLAAEKRSPDIVQNLFRDNRIESLIMKADKVLSSLSHTSGVDSPPNPDVGVSAPSYLEDSEQTSEELQRCPTSCYHPDTGCTVSAAVGVAEALSDRGPQSCCVHGDKVFRQPGPVEALKQMLFRLQMLETELLRRQQASEAPSLKSVLQAADRILE